MSIILKPTLGSQLNLGHRLSKGLVGFWPFNEGSGNKVFDLSGNGNAGVFINNTLWVPGKFGSSVYFDGVDDYIDCGNKAIVRPTSLTLIVWAKRDSSNQADPHGTLVQCVGFNDGYELMIQRSDSQLWWASSANWAVNLTGDVPVDGQWFQFAMVYDSASGTKIYYNGLETDSDGNTGNLTYTGTPNLIMGSRGGVDFAGSVDNVYLYNRALTASEIAELYREPFAMFDRMPIELWVGATSVGVPPGVTMSAHYYRHLLQGVA